jgi:hypothetical protein
VPGGKDSSLVLRLGRQELIYGSSRLVSAREGPNIRRSFDGLRSIADLGRWHIEGFGVQVVEPKDGTFDDHSRSDRSLWGIYAAKSPIVAKEALIDIYYLGFHRNPSTYGQGTEREERHTFGYRLSGRREAWDFDLEMACQVGRFGKGRISAWLAALNTGWIFDSFAWKPRIGLKTNVATGDRDPGRTALQTFNPLFSNASYFNETGMIGLANIIDLHPSLTVTPFKGFSWIVDLDLFWRYSTRDAIYSNSLRIQRQGDQSRARYAGSALSTSSRWQINPFLVVTGAYTHFFPGRFLKESCPGKHTDYAGLWMSFRF